jgi:hypothetical protein
MPISVVQSTYPEMRGGFISSGREGGSAIYFDFANIIGPPVLVGDRVRYVHQKHGRERAVNVQVIPKQLNSAKEAAA